MIGTRPPAPAGTGRQRAREPNRDPLALGGMNRRLGNLTALTERDGRVWSLAARWELVSWVADQQRSLVVGESDGLFWQSDQVEE